MYKISDEISVGVVSSSGGTVYYTSPVDADEAKYAWAPDDMPLGLFELSNDYTAWLRSEMTFGDFKADILANGTYVKSGAVSIFEGVAFGDLEYAMDPFTFYLPYEVYLESGTDGITDVTFFGFYMIPAVKYAITDEFYVAAELGFSLCVA